MANGQPVTPTFNFSSIPGHLEHAWEDVKNLATTGDISGHPETTLKQANQEIQNQDQMNQGEAQYKDWLYQNKSDEFRQAYPVEYLARKGYNATQKAIVSPAEEGMTESQRKEIAPKIEDLVETGLGAYGISKPGEPKQTILGTGLVPPEFLGEEGMTESVPKNKSEKIFYHGTTSNLQDINKAAADVYSPSTGLMGIGTYITDNPEVASGYATTKGKGAERVLGVKEPSGTYLDAELPANEKVKQIFANAAPHDSEPLEGKTPRQLFQNLRERFYDSGWSTNEALEPLQQLTIDLRKEGYDGIKYEGGKTARGQKYGPHEVRVIFPDYEGKPIKLEGAVPSKLDFNSIPGHEIVKSSQ